MVESQPSKLLVAGSIPVSRSSPAARAVLADRRNLPSRVTHQNGGRIIHFPDSW